jgi:hypothetical protein
MVPNRKFSSWALDASATTSIGLNFVQFVLRQQLSPCASAEHVTNFNSTPLVVRGIELGNQRQQLALRNSLRLHVQLAQRHKMLVQRKLPEHVFH